MEPKTEFQLILEELKKLNERVSKLESSPSALPTTPNESKGKKTSLKEFLLEINPADDVQRTLAISYYLENQEGMASFNKTDIDKGFRTAKERVPSNINDKVGMCIKNGYMMEAEDKKDSLKAWVLTSTGEKVVTGGFKKPPTE